MEELFIPIDDFLSSYQLNSSQLMWFLGAGTSRSANLSTASDLTWDIKKRIYCAKENLPFEAYDLNSQAVKARIQAYMESQGYPKLWSQEEYSFYFELFFKSDYQKQQRYIEWALNPNRVSLNVGHRILASLIKMNMIKVLYTTNFDTVVEQAYSKVDGHNLNVFNIEGSYASLDALNNESFPFYVKLHGDFRFRSIKNLSEDLLENDEELQNCFLASASRFGMVVSGYSGRDSNVMSMMSEALNTVNPFPKGIYWAVPSAKNTEAEAINFIKKARSKGVKAAIVETGTFDEFMSRIWRQLPNKPEQLERIVKLHSARDVRIPIPLAGTKEPLLRTNMLPVNRLKLECGVFKTSQNFTYAELSESERGLGYRVTYCLPDDVLYWGNTSDAIKIIPNYRQLDIGTTTRTIDSTELENGILKGFVEESIVRAICRNNPALMLRKSGKSWFLVIKEQFASTSQFIELRQAVGFRGEEPINGEFRQSEETWSECVQIGLQLNEGDIYLYLKPDIWIKPKKEREKHTDFIRKRKSHRYNPKSYKILDAWITILFGSTKSSATFSNPQRDDFAPLFEITTRTAYSKRG